MTPHLNPTRLTKEGQREGARSSVELEDSKAAVGSEGRIDRDLDLKGGR